MLSTLLTLAVVKLAIKICNNPHIKREILRVSDSDYYASEEHEHSLAGEIKEMLWYDIVEKKAEVILRKLEIPEKFMENLISVILSVALRMLSWAVYHQSTLGFSRDFSFKFLNSSFFTSRGLIDRKKAAEHLVYHPEKHLSYHISISQKYKLALMYCLNENVALDLYMKMKEENKNPLHDPENQLRIIINPSIVNCWYYYHMGDLDQIRGETDPHIYMLQRAIESGCKDAVENLLKHANLSLNEDVLIYAGLETISNIKEKRDICNVVFEGEICFWAHSLSGTLEKMLQKDTYTDLMIFLLLKMREDQKIEFLKQDINRNHKNHSKVLEYVLNWPYQDYFMIMARLVWEYLPPGGYAELLRLIVSKIESSNERTSYGEEKNYDYKKLFSEFWKESPERNKIYVLGDPEIISENGDRSESNAGMIILNKLFTLKDLTLKDLKNINLILNSATNELKKNIISSKLGKVTCKALIRRTRWNVVDTFISSCFVSEKEVEIFKRDFVCQEAYNICANFLLNYKWNEVDSFISWSSLTEEEINKLKKEIYSKEGKNACLDIISYCKQLKTFDERIRWFSPTEEQATILKRELLFSNEGMNKCVELVIRDQIELANEFINGILFSDEEIRLYKKSLARKIESKISSLLYNQIVQRYHSNRFSDRLIERDIGYSSEGPKWENIAKCLTWCFSLNDEILFLKANFLRIVQTESDL